MAIVEKNVRKKIGKVILLALALMAGAGSAVAGQPPVKIGILTARENPGEGTERGAALAAQMAIDDLGGTVLNRPVRLIVGDHKDRPSVGAIMARRWLKQSDVDVILDIQNAGVAKAVRPVVSELGGLLILSGVGFYGPRDCQENILSWTYDLPAMSRFGLAALRDEGFDQTYMLNLEMWHGSGLPFREIVDSIGFGQFQEFSRPLPPPTGRAIRIAAGAAPLIAPDEPLAVNRDALVVLGANPFALKAVAPHLSASLKGRPLSDLYCQACASMLDNPAVSSLAETIYFVLPYDLDSKPYRALAERFIALGDGAAPSMAQVGIYTATRAYLESVATLGKTRPAAAIAAHLRSVRLHDDIFGNSAITPAGVRRGTYYLYAYDSASGTRTKLAQKDMTGEAGTEPCDHPSLLPGAPPRLPPFRPLGFPPPP